MPARRAFLLLGLWGVGGPVSSAQELSGPPATVLRSQYESIASQLADSVAVYADSLAVIVEGSRMRYVAESACAEAFQNRGLTVSFQPGDRPLLKIAVLDEGFANDSLQASANATKLTLEARLESPSADVIRFFGRFERAVRAESGASSFFERFGEPLALITGSALVIYLLFTVRN